MKQSDKIRVAVLYGGRSAEHEISLQSAANVIEYLDPAQFEVIPIGIDKAGQWYLGKDVFNQSLHFNKVEALAEETWFTPEWLATPYPAKGNHHLSTLKHSIPAFDVVFPVVHGSYCEDGSLQGLLELADVPYVGCHVLASAIGMDKDISKRLAKAAGISVGPYLAFKQAQWIEDPSLLSTRITQELGFPVFVKPTNTGSSIGITKVKTAAGLAAAIDFALQFDTKVIVEKALEVIELEVAVLESLESECHPMVSVVGEIRTQHEFYSYDAKYVDEKGAEIFIPAPYDADILQQAQQMAKAIFLTLECQGMARVDLFLDKERHQLYFNEINTIPGFTSISMYPKLMAASGISYSALLSHLIQLAIKHHKNKSQLKRSYTK